MHYDPIKELLGRLFNKSPFLRKGFYSVLDVLLLRTWHIHKALKNNLSSHSSDIEILDAGMGFGQYSFWMAKRFRRSHITAVDIKSEQVSDCNGFFKACNLSERINAMEANLVTYRQPDSYDLILCVDVMEHIAEDTDVFENFYASLHDSGMLVISTPSDKGGSDADNNDGESFIGEHVRDGYSIQDITAKLTAAGFSSTEVSYTYGKPGSMAWQLTMKYPVMMLSFSKLMFLLLPFYYILVMPVSLFLNYLDLTIKHRQGTGLMVIARK